MASRRYWLSGIQIESELPLRTVPPSTMATPAGSPLVHLRLRPIATTRVEAWDVRETDVAVGSDPDAYYLRYEGEVTFRVDRSGREIACEIVPPTDDETVEQLFVDQIFPLILHALGRQTLHAGAVVVGGGVVAFVGDTGLGKSTLASSVATEQGARIFCDDCLAITIEGDRALAFPSYASTRLWPESADALFAARGVLPRATPRTEKRRLHLSWDGAPLPLRRIHLLERSDGPVTITRLGRAAAIGAILRHLNRLDGLDRERLVGEMDFLEALVTRVPVSRLAYRRDFADLPAVHRAILDDVAEG
jgi:hypothetical protein